MNFLWRKFLHPYPPLFIKNIYVFQNQRRELKNIMVFEDGHWEISEHLPHEADSTPFNIINAKAKYTLMPGLLDSHVHGYGGVDFADVSFMPEQEGLSRIMHALGKTGLSYAMATLVSLELPLLEKTLKVIDSYCKKQMLTSFRGDTKLVGVHLEGPFIAEKCKGAHASSALQPSINIDLFREIIAAAPTIKQWKITLAPDLPGALKFISHTKELEREGIFVKVFIGHCNPIDKEIIGHAIAAGACGFTHLGNACEEACARASDAIREEDSRSHVVQWVLENPELCPPGVELIVDGKHLTHHFISLITKSIKDKVVLITDALGPSGCSDGLYQLGSLSIRKEENTFYLADSDGSFQIKKALLLDGKKVLTRSLAGSGAPLSFCIKKYVELMNLPDEDAIFSTIYSSAIQNPRTTSLSLDAIDALPDDKNFAIFDKRGELIMSLCNGKLRAHQVFQQKKEKIRFFDLDSEILSLEKKNDNSFSPS